MNDEHTKNTFGVSPAKNGWEYTVYIGCDTLAPTPEATADRMIGGWKPTREQAVKQANRVLGRQANNE